MRRMLAIGRHYRDHSGGDISVLLHQINRGTRKGVIRDYEVSPIGGGAVVAAFTAAQYTKGKVLVDLLATVGQDDDGLALVRQTQRFDIQLHHRPVQSTSQSFVFHEGEERTIARFRKTDGYLGDFVRELEGYALLHVDGHQGDATLHYAERLHQQSVVTSFDFGTLREGPEGTWSLLRFIEVASISSDVCKDNNISYDEMVARVRACGCSYVILTLGRDGLVWYGPDGISHPMRAPFVRKEDIIDTCNSGDIHNGARCASMLLRSVDFENHLAFANEAVAESLKCRGALQKIESLPDMASIASRLGPRLVSVSA